MNREYLNFKKWFNANKERLKNEISNENLAWAAWSTAIKQESKKNNDDKEDFYLDFE